MTRQLISTRRRYGDGWRRRGVGGVDGLRLVGAPGGGVGVAASVALAAGKTREAKGANFKQRYAGACQRGKVVSVDSHEIKL